MYHYIHISVPVIKRTYSLHIQSIAPTQSIALRPTTTKNAVGPALGLLGVDDRRETSSKPSPLDPVDADVFVHSRKNRGRSTKSGSDAQEAERGRV